MYTRKQDNKQIIIKITKSERIKTKVKLQRIKELKLNYNYKVRTKKIKLELQLQKCPNYKNTATDRTIKTALWSTNS